MSIFVYPWKRYRRARCQWWHTGNTVIARDFDSPVGWYIFYCGNRSLKFWRNASAAKLAAEHCAVPVLFGSISGDIWEAYPCKDLIPKRGGGSL